MIRNRKGKESMNGKKSEYVESKGMNSKDNGRKRSLQRQAFASKANCKARENTSPYYAQTHPPVPFPSLSNCLFSPLSSLTFHLPSP